MRVILVHGMGRSPFSMALLAWRLRRAGMRPCFFWYWVTFEGWDACRTRLRHFMARRIADGAPYIVAGHSLGAVLLRAVVPELARPPSACFLLAPPSKACNLAQRLAGRRWYRLLTGEMGQVLADPARMDAVPPPPPPARIYVGTGWPFGRWSLCGLDPNDGILTVEETRLPGVPLVEVPALHSFIMNAPQVAQDMIRTMHGLRDESKVLTP